ncbi:MAG TPA: GNAT family N-acetyltransferase [Pseudobacteroides sp.]|uniref:GNAT family N-acetyltransferase n=1 Tax=Pseudobacteroides sp. TaxID=1968840 RepID=UPI002F94F6DB
MEIRYLSKNEYTNYMRLVFSIYKGNKYFKDTNASIIKEFFSGKSHFCRNARISPVMVMNEGTPLACCIFVIHNSCRHILQIAFFEAMPNCRKAVDLLMSEAKSICQNEGAGKIIIGINGHVNYGLGILSDNFDKTVSFGSNYGCKYYHDYFLDYNPVTHNLNSYTWDMNTFNMERERKILERVNRRYTFRLADLSKLKKEIEIFTDINNKSFEDDLFYTPRDPKEDYELFKNLSYFLKGENLIFAEDNGKPIGLILWYPDYNEMVKLGKSIGAAAFLNFRLLKPKISKLKLSEIAVLPQYHGTGVIAGLFYKALEKSKGKYEYGESSWVIQDNSKSDFLCKKLAHSEYKHYKVYEINDL